MHPPSAVLSLALGWAIGTLAAVLLAGLTGLPLWVDSPDSAYAWIAYLVAGLGGRGDFSPWLGPLAALALLAWGHDRRVRMAALAALAALFFCHWERSAAEWRGLMLPLPGASRELHLTGTVLRPPEQGRQGNWYFRVNGQPESGGPDWIVDLQVGAPAVPDTAAGMHLLRRGDRVRVWCRLRGPHRGSDPTDPTLTTRSRGIDATGWVKSVRLVERLGPGARRHLPATWADDARLRARAQLDRWLGTSSDSRGIAGAMLLGDRRGLSERCQRELRESGLVHLIAISGLHVGLIWGMFAKLSRRFRHGHLWLALGSTLALPIFGYFVGARPSVVRAILFTGLALAANALGRRVDAGHVLTLACTLSLAGHPSVWASGGFQLSFAATTGLVLGAGRLAPALPLPSILGIPIAASIASYAATAPFSAGMFGQLAPASLLSNLLGVPLAAAILIGGYGSLLISVWTGGPALPGWSLALDGLAQVSRLALAIGPSPVWVARPNVYLCACGILAWILVHSDRLRRRGWKTCCRGIALAVFLGVHIGPPPTEPPRTLVRLLDVGQGQSVWLQRGERSLLIDAGGNPFGSYDPGARVVVPSLLSAGLRRLDAVAVSHEDTDHAAGVEAVLRAIAVDELWLGPDAHRSPRLRRLRALARRGGAAVRILGRRAGEMDYGRWRIRWYDLPFADCDKTNDRSLILRVADADVDAPDPGSVLIAGDLEECGVNHLLGVSRGGPLRSRLLILAHHGSRSGTSRDWLRQVGPAEAWVSAGFRNRFGHPHRAVRDRVRAAGLRLRRTDREGTVESWLDAIGE